MSKENLNPFCASNLRTGAQWLEDRSRRSVPIKRFIADDVLALVPPSAEILDIWYKLATGHNGMNPYGITAATLVATGVSLSLFEAGRWHGDTQMQFSEWIGPGIARGMRTAADVINPHPTNSD